MQVSGILADISGGGYISIFKIVPMLLVLMVWAKLLTWVDKDTLKWQMPREKVNLGLLGGLIVAFAIFFVIPQVGLPIVSFILGLLLLLIGLGVEVAVYLHMRKARGGTTEDLKEQFKLWVESLKGKKAPEKPEIAEGQVAMLDEKGVPVPPPAKNAPEKPIFDALQSALAEPLLKGAEQIDLAPETEGLATKYVVDGVVYRGAVIPSQAGAFLISVLKDAAGLNVDEVRKPQSGSFKVYFNGKKREFKVQTAGTRAGEYMRLAADAKKRPNITLANLGLSERQTGILKDLIADRKGLVLVSAPKGQGLTTTFYAILRAHDVFIEHIQTIEREGDDGVDGTTTNRLPPNVSAEDEAKKLEWVISQEPDVIAMCPVEGKQTAHTLIAYAKSGKRAYVGLRASSTFDAIDQWRRLVGDDSLAMSQLRFVINSRIIRRLCPACKVGYAPDAPTLRKLGIDPERVTALFQARSAPARDPKGNIVPCEVCQELRFKGRLGVYETLMVEDDIREAIITGKSPSQAFRKQRGKYLQEEALSVVEKGETSVQEVLRVLKAAPAPPRSGGGVTAGKAEA